VIEQKRQNRTVAMQGMAREAGPNYRPPAALSPAAATSPSSGPVDWQTYFGGQKKMPIVAIPDGEQVSFPDSMTPDNILGIIEQKFPDHAASFNDRFSAAGAYDPTPEALDQGLSRRQ